MTAPPQPGQPEAPAPGAASAGPGTVLMTVPPQTGQPGALVAGAVSAGPVPSSMTVLPQTGRARGERGVGRTATMAGTDPGAGECGA